METIQQLRSRAIVIQDFENLLDDLHSKENNYICNNNYIICQVK